MSEYKRLYNMLDPKLQDGECTLTDAQLSRQMLAKRYVAVRATISDDDAVDIVRAFVNGKSNAQIAQEMNLDISVPRAVVAYACDQDVELYHRHLDPPDGKDPDPMTRTTILRRVPPLM